MVVDPEAGHNIIEFEFTLGSKEKGAKPAKLCIALVMKSMG